MDNRLLVNEILDWIRLNRKDFTHVTECLWVGDDESWEKQYREDEFKEGYNQALDDLKQVLTTLKEQVNG